MTTSLKPEPTTTVTFDDVAYVLDGVDARAAAAFGRFLRAIAVTRVAVDFGYDEIEELGDQLAAAVVVAEAVKGLLLDGAK